MDVLSFEQMLLEVEDRRQRWDRFGMELAETVARKSKDPSTKVGAVLMDQDNNVVSVGYNGFPRHVRDYEDRYADRETKYKFVVHAELNAVLRSKAIDTDVLTLYCTLSPCNECAKAIIQAGNITRVVYKELRQNDVTDQMFEEALISMEPLGD